jgi:hypothetical protein
MVLKDLWEIERNETEWLRIENLKKLYTTIERDLVELKYPELAELFVKRQIQKEIDILERR